MATAIPNANINIPYSEFLDQNTGRPSQAWLQWLMNPNVISVTTSNTNINGGTINNVIINNSTIGLTTPAAGKFTDFTALNGVKGGIF
jgi:hypothetical protein